MSPLLQRLSSLGTGLRVRASQLLAPVHERCVCNTLKAHIYSHLVCSCAARADDFFFVQVGGFDGVSNDYLYELVTEFSLPGVILEPQKEAFAKLQQAYASQPQVRLLNAAVALEPGETVIYSVKPPFDVHASGKPIGKSVASLDPKHPYSYALKHSKHTVRGRSYEEVLHEEAIRCISFADVVAECGIDHIDLLHVDAEGSDYIIVSAALEQFLPSIVNFEHKGLDVPTRDKAWSLLRSKGYLLMTHRPDYGDTVAMQPLKETQPSLH